MAALPDELEDLWHDFRRALARKNRSDSTLSVYRKSFEAFWTWAVAEGLPPDPAAVTHTIVNRWTDHLITVPVVRNGRVVEVEDPDGTRRPKTLEPSTRRIRFINLRPFFSWWAKEFDALNPFDRADVPGEDRATPIPVVPVDDIRRLLATCDGKDFEDRRDAAIIRVLYDTGARLGELVALDVDDWDRRNDFLTLRGKTGTRVVPISPSTGEALSRYMRVRRDHSHAKRDALWLGTKGKLGDSGIAQILRRRCELAGIEHLNPHRFRHTFAHTFRVKGGSEGDLMYLCGWKSTAMAHRYGRSAAAERAQNAARSLSIGDEL